MYKLLSVQSHSDKKRFIAFIYALYRSNPAFKDMQVRIVKQFLYKKDSFIRQCLIQPVLVEIDGKIAAECMFIYHEKLPVLQMSFFEALPGEAAAVDMLLTAARVKCRELGLKKIVIGLNGHVSYGVGLLTDCFDVPISFDSLYSQSYYPGFFGIPGIRKVTLTTYFFEMEHIHFREKILQKVDKELTFRTMDKRRFKAEIMLMGELCNLCFNNTYLYFERDPYHMYELLKGLKCLLKPEHLIFAMQGGKEVGFMFWHPDYNELMPEGRRNTPLSLFLRYLWAGKSIGTLKLNTIGILPASRNSGALIGLVHETYCYAQNQFMAGETNFVWDNNRDSRAINIHLTDREFRHYCVYELDITDDR